MLRSTAIEYLGDLYEDKGIATPWLHPYLRDREWLVRVETIESLTRIGDKSALPLLIKMLQDEHNIVRSYAAHGIGDLCGKRYKSELRQALKDEADERAKVGMAYGLFALGDTSALSLLIDFLGSSSYVIRCAAANSMVDLDLDAQQHEQVVAAVSHAAENSLFPADRSTMEKIKKELLERQHRNEQTH